MIDTYKQYREKKKNAPPPSSLGGHLWSWVKTIVWAVSVVTIINGLALASFTVPTGSMERTVMAGDYVFVNKLVYGPSTPQIIPFINMPLPFYKTPPLMDPEQGDVIVFIFPGNRDQAEPDNFEYYLKRCVAVSGDVIEIRAQRVYVNGEEFVLPEHGQFMAMSEEYRQTLYAGERLRTFPPGKGWTHDDYGPLTVPAEGDVIELTQSNIHEWATFIRREGHDVDERKLLVDGSPASNYVVERDYVFGMGDNRDNSLDSRFWGFIPQEDVVGTPMFVYWSWEPDNYNRTLTLIERLSTIRWSRLGTIIN